jgi:hypothetical protein
MPHKKLSTKEFIDRCKVIHGNKYDYSKTILETTKNKIIITCPVHGDFSIMPFNHLINKQGCKICFNESRMLSKDEYFKRVKKKFKDYFSYNEGSFINVNENIEIYCPIHGHYIYNAKSHLYSKFGCPKCTTAYARNTKYTKEEFIEKCNKIHKNKFNYDKVEYYNRSKLVIITCPIHGDFKQSPAIHMRGCGCNKCSNENKNTNKLTKNMFIKKSIGVHGMIYDYSKVEYIHAHKKVTIICPKHGEFYQEPASHIYSKCGCPKCKESKAENIIRDMLMKNNIFFISQHKFLDCKYKRPLPFDFYIPDINCVIEFQGEQHYNPLRFLSKVDGIKKLKDTRRNDVIKKQYCTLKSIYLFEITYKDNIKEKINTLLKYYFSFKCNLS